MQMVYRSQSSLSMPEIKAIIFDFDGVILDSVDAKTQAFAELFEQYGEAVVKQVVKHHEANGGISRFEKIRHYHSNFLGIELSAEEVDKIADQFSLLVLDKVLSSSYVPGAEAFIKNNKKYELFISTGTPQNEIEYILQQKKIRQYFCQVLGSPTSKDIHIKKILADTFLKPSEIIFVGDSMVDYYAAKSNLVPFVGRYTSDKRIKTIGAKLITDIRDLL